MTDGGSALAAAEALLGERGGEAVLARGPMALLELTSYKWVVRGQGQVREP